MTECFSFLLYSNPLRHLAHLLKRATSCFLYVPPRNDVSFHEILNQHFDKLSVTSSGWRIHLDPSPCSGWHFNFMFVIAKLWKKLWQSVSFWGDYRVAIAPRNDVLFFRSFAMLRMTLYSLSLFSSCWTWFSTFKFELLFMRFLPSQEWHCLFLFPHAPSGPFAKTATSCFLYALSPLWGLGGLFPYLIILKSFGG